MPSISNIILSLGLASLLQIATATPVRAPPFGTRATCTPSPISHPVGTTPTMPLTGGKLHPLTFVFPSFTAISSLIHPRCYWTPHHQPFSSICGYRPRHSKLHLHWCWCCLHFRRCPRNSLWCDLPRLLQPKPPQHYPRHCSQCPSPSRFPHYRWLPSSPRPWEALLRC